MLAGAVLISLEGVCAVGTVLIFLEGALVQVLECDAIINSDPAVEMVGEVRVAAVMRPMRTRKRRRGACQTILTSGLVSGYSIAETSPSSGTKRFWNSRCCDTVVAYCNSWEERDWVEEEGGRGRVVVRLRGEHLCMHAFLSHPQGAVALAGR